MALPQRLPRALVAQAIEDENPELDPVAARALQEERRREMARSSDDRIAEEVARLKHLEAEAWGAWQRGRDSGEPARGEYLRLVQWCIKRRCELFGLDAPRRTRADNHTATLAVAEFLQRLMARQEARTASPPELPAPRVETDPS